jgi:hypothetical protein
MEKELLRALDRVKSNRETAMLLTSYFPENKLEDLIAFQRAYLKKLKRASIDRKKGGVLKQNQGHGN